MFWTHLSRMGSVHRLGLVQRAIGILRKYGADAHVYLPGVGTISGITAGNYLDSAGVTAASVDNPVGLSLDALQAANDGTELITGASRFTSLFNCSVSNGGAVPYTQTATASANYQAFISGVLTVGQWYEAKVTWVGNTSQRWLYLDGNLGTPLSNAVSGTVTTKFMCTGPSTVVGLGVIAGQVGESVTVTSISYIQHAGIHATQATTANKPILRLNSGKYSWQFDGSNDYLSLGAPLFQMSDDHCVIAGCKIETSTTLQAIAIVSASASGFVCAIIGDTTNGLKLQYRNDALISFSTTISTVALNDPFVVSGRNVGGVPKGRKNGGAFATVSNPTGVFTLDRAYLGFHGTFNNLGGSLYPVIAIKGTVSDADLLTLERFVGQLSGVSL